MAFDPSRDTQRSVSAVGDGLSSLRIRRPYPATADSVWDAVTNPECLERWFLAPAGDLRIGGQYRLQDNASGRIVVCDRPTFLAVTWELGDVASTVRLRLEATPDGTIVELEQLGIPAARVANASSESWGLGAVWEMRLVALGRYLDNSLPEGPATQWSARELKKDRRRVQGLATAIGAAWTDVLRASGQVSADPNSWMLETHLSNKPVPVLDTYTKLLDTVTSLGPFSYAVSPVTITFRRRRRTFAGAQLTDSALVIFVDLPRQAHHARLTKVTPHSRWLWAHEFHLTRPADLDDALLALVEEAWQAAAGTH